MFKIVEHIKRYWQLWVAAIVALFVGKKVSEKKSKKEIKKMLAQSREAIDAERRISAQKSASLDKATAEYSEKIDHILGQHEEKLERIERKRNKTNKDISAEEATQALKDRLR